MEKSIYRASVSGNVEFLKELLEEDGGIEALVTAGFIAPFKVTPPLHVAAMLGHLDFVKLLLRHLPNLVTPLDSQGRTPLHYAAAAGHILVVKAILSSSIHDDNARTAIHVPDAGGNTPLHLAIMNGQLGVVNELVSCGALEAVGYGLDGRAGKCLLHFCVMYGRLEALKSLLESREVNDDRVLAIKDGDGNTVLHLATTLNQLETVKYLLQNTGVRATVNTINGQGSTALDIAQHMPMKSHSKRAEILEAIIKAGGSSASNLRHPPQTINSGVGSKEMMILPEVEAGAVVLNLEPPPATPPRPRSGSRKAAKTPLTQPAGTKSTEEQNNRMEKLMEEKTNTIMLSATVIASMVYQGVINPPGGVWQEHYKDPDDPTKVYFPGKSVMASLYPGSYKIYAILNKLAFFVSMATIAVVMSGFKRRVWMINALSAAMWVTMSCASFTFMTSAAMVSKKQDPSAPVTELVDSFNSVEDFGVLITIILTTMLGLILYCSYSKKKAFWCDSGIPKTTRSGLS